MKPSEQPSSPPSYLGHVKNGVLVPDVHSNLVEGQAVRIEPLGQEPPTSLEREQADRVRQLQRLFEQWTAEDGQLADEEADRLRIALKADCALTFRSPSVA